MPDTQPRNLLSRFFCVPNGQVVIVQWPNAALWAFLIASLIAHFTHGDAHILLQVLANISLTVWAVMELKDGVNGWRKTLGFIVLMYCIFKLSLN